LHLVEHILLRPLNRKNHASKVPNDFYAFRISVIFPSWTARFNDPEFRKFAQETVRLNCPAHVLPDFHWLGLDQMRTFEGLYRKWLDAKCDREGVAEKIDDGSRALIAFLGALRDQQA